jgi:hypothetical protein
MSAAKADPVIVIAAIIPRSNFFMLIPLRQNIPFCKGT